MIRDIEYNKLRYRIEIDQNNEVQFWLIGGVSDYGENVEDLISTELFPANKYSDLHLMDDMNVTKNPIRLLRKIYDEVLKYIQLKNPDYLKFQPTTDDKISVYKKGLEKLCSELNNYELYNDNKAFYIIRMN